MPEENVLYASEMIGAVRGRNPDTGKWFDDTKYLLDQLDDVSDSHRAKILGENALRVYPRLRRVLEARGLV
jgi:4-oxalmesaconate hydratase